MNLFLVIIGICRIMLCLTASDAEARYSSGGQLNINNNLRLLVERQEANSPPDRVFRLTVLGQRKLEGEHLDIYSTREPKIRIINGPHGSRYLYVEECRAAAQASIHVIRGGSFVDVWSDVSKIGVVSRFRRNGAVDIFIPHFAYQVDGHADMKGTAIIIEAYRFRSGAVFHVRDVRAPRRADWWNSKLFD